MAEPVMSEHPSPALIFETMQAYHRTEALKAAIELHLFTVIADGAHTAAEIGAKCDASPKGIRALCDFLTIIGFLTKGGDGAYGLTLDSSVFLNEHSPAYQGGITRFIAHPHLHKYFQDLAGVVRKGGALVDDEGSVSPDNPIWVDFARGMMPMMMPAAQRIAELTAKSGPMKVLDIAAGHGLFGIMVAKQNPEAQIYAVDWRNVLAVAGEHAAQFGVAGQLHRIEGSAFEVPFGSDYDLALVTNFIHHFDQATNVTLLKKVRAALKPGGSVAILEFAVNEDRITPVGAATFVITMLATTAAGDAYSFNEIESMFRERGSRV
jgi:O-methyltransferase domain/Dimerisation domain